MSWNWIRGIQWPGYMATGYPTSCYWNDHGAGDRVARRVQVPANPSPGVLMQRTREELADLLRESQEHLKKSRSTHRKLKTVITKVNKVIGRRRSVKRKPPK